MCPGGHFPCLRMKNGEFIAKIDDFDMDMDSIVVRDANLQNDSINDHQSISTRPLKGHLAIPMVCALGYDKRRNGK